MKNMMELRFLNSSENEAFARTVAAAFAVRLDPTVEELAEIKTAVSEAVTNAIIHGYEGREGYVYIKGEAEADVLTFTVEDKGRGIENIQMARSPMYTGKPDDERSGMGFTIMEAFMDEVDVISSPGEGTSVIMKKRISAGRTV